jgi:adenosylmethionine-8-amino-7-oxononanoate aminotransferase
MKKGTGYFMHAQTYMQAPMMTVGGVAALSYMDKHHLVENSEKVGAVLLQRLREELLMHPHVGAINGKGLFLGVEFVESKAGKRPFERSQKMVESLVNQAFENGLVLWPNVGHADGINGDLVMLGPPLTLTAPQAEEIVQLLKKSLNDLFST